MAKSLEEWVDTEVRTVKSESLHWLSGHFFFRDPPRPTYSDTSLFFSPADGVIVYQAQVKPDEPVIPTKGRQYSLRDAMRDPSYDRPSLVIGIFMTFYDVHVNRVPYAGTLSYRHLGRIDTYNNPMLDVEKSLLEDLRVPSEGGTFLHRNERVLNRIQSPTFGEYYVLQIADYDVDCITPFSLKQKAPYHQGQRFSQIRYGSQVDLIIPLREDHEITPIQSVTNHVEAGTDPLVSIDPSPVGRHERSLIK